MKYCLFLLASGIGLWAAVQEPMTVDIKDSAAKRWLDKKVMANRVLDERQLNTSGRVVRRGSAQSAFEEKEKGR